MNNSKVVIIDYGSGNLRSVFNALESVKNSDQQILISSNSSNLKDASHIILPGVGAFKDCMKGLLSCPNMIEEIKLQIQKGKKFLGICVGMQLLADVGFEDGETAGLGLIKGKVKRLNNDQGELKIPHIGWNNLNILRSHSILEGIKENDHAYFVHSYYFELEDTNNALAQSSYGSNKINAVIAKNNIIATQFHPEKSAEAGLKLLKNFINL